MQSPSDYYDQMVTAGDIRNDTNQRQALVHMDFLHRQLLTYAPPQKQGLFKWFFAKKKYPVDTAPAPPKGIYIHGTVGNGKTVLLQCFYETAPTDKKLYFHLHQFLLDVNTRLKQYSDNTVNESHIMNRVIESYIKQAWVFCFDECVVGDVADAMLFGQIVTGIIERGGVLVCTSNFSPALLKPRGGVGNNVFQRYAKRFFAHMHTHDMNSPTDYRIIEDDNQWRFYWHAETLAQREQLLDDFIATAAKHIVKDAWHQDTVAVRDRRVPVPQVNNGTCVFQYTHIIEGAFGAEDFMAIAKKYHTIILKNVTPITADNTSFIKRFIVFIDCLYENKARLVITATCPPKHIYPNGLVAFEFSRALSRLNAMQAIGYSRA